MAKFLAPLAGLYTLVAVLVLAAAPLAAEDPATTESVPQQTTAPAPAPAPAAPEAGEPAQPPAKPAQQAEFAQRAQAEEPEADDAPVAFAAGPGSVAIRDFSFSPGSITVHVGDTVTWTNTGDESHTATGSGFDTGLLSKGQSGSHTFSEAGSFSYICTPHPFMKGAVVVRASSSGGGGSGGGGSGSGSGSAGGSTGGGTGGGSDAGGGNASGSGDTATGDSLPASGADAWALAVLGLGLLALGLLTRRRVGEGS